MMRGKPVPSDLYWKVRATQAEASVLREKLASLNTARASFAMLSRVVGDSQQMIEGLIPILDGLVKSAATDGGAVVQEIGKQVGLEGDPTEWVLDLGRGPESARISTGD